MKIVIDTNLYISFLISKILKKLINKIINNKIEILTSIEQKKEVFDVINRDKFKNYFGEEEKIELFYLIESVSKEVNIKKKVHDCRDKNDNFILNIALNGKADYIITGDIDLLVINPYKGIKIFSYKEFKEKIFNII